MAEKKVYRIRAPGALVEVTKEIYLTYYRMARRDRAQKEQDTYNGSFSYDALDTDELLKEKFFPSRDAVGGEDTTVTNVLRDKLHCRLNKFAFVYSVNLTVGIRQFNQQQFWQLLQAYIPSQKAASANHGAATFCVSTEFDIFFCPGHWQTYIAKYP